MPPSRTRHWVFPSFRLSTRRRASADPAPRPPHEAVSCTLHIALANASPRTARFEARFWSVDSHACDELAFTGQLGPHASRQFDLPEQALQHVAAESRPSRAGDAEWRSGWFEIEASEDVHVSAWQRLGANEDRPRAQSGCFQPLNAREAAASPAPPSRDAGGMRGAEAAPEHQQPPQAGRRTGERRKDPRCAVIQREIDALDRELLGLRTQWASAASSSRPGLDSLIEAVCAEQRGLADEALRFGCRGIRCDAAEMST